MLALKMDPHRVVLSSLFVAEWTYMLVVNKIWPGNKGSISLRDSSIAIIQLIPAMLQVIFRKPRMSEVHCKADNASLVETWKSSNLVGDQHLKVDVTRVKEMMMKKKIQTEWIRGWEQFANCLTKMGVSFDIRRDLLQLLF